MKVRDVIMLIISIIRLVISIAFFIGSLLLVNKLGVMEFNCANETSEHYLKNEELRRLEDEFIVSKQELFNRYEKENNNGY